MRFHWALGLATTLAFAAPAHAQQAGEADIEALLDASATPEAALTLAAKQEGEGDLTAAAATIERAMLASPKSTALRLHYVALLCRLDDRQRARVELARAGEGDISGVRAACGDIAMPERKSGNGWRGQLGLGVAWDSDAMGALALRLDIPTLIYPHTDGVALVASAGVTGRSAIGGNAFFYGNFAAQTHNDVSGPDYDYQLANAAAGFGVRAGQVELSGGGMLLHARVGGDGFLTEYGGQAQVALIAAADTRVTLRGEIAGQDYIDVPLLSRDGTRYDAALDVGGGGDRRLAWVLGGGIERKTADTSYLAYHAYRLYAAARVPIGQGGTYAGLGGTMRHIDYFDDPTTRDYVETRWYGRAALGVPLGGNFFAEGAASYTRRDYDAASFLRDYHSFGGELRLIYRFGE